MKVRRWFKGMLLAGATLLMLSEAVNANADEPATEVGTVTLFSNSGTLALIYNTTSVIGTGSGRCSQNVPATSPYAAARRAMYLDISTTGGQAMYSLLLAAAVSGKSVTFFYTLKSSDGSCTLDGVFL